MSDRRIGEQALEVGLAERAEGAGQHGQGREQPDQVGQIVPDRSGHRQQPDQRSNHGTLGTGRQQTRDRGRSPLVDIGRPEMEGGQGDLETNRNQDHAPAKQAPGLQFAGLRRQAHDRVGQHQ